MKAKLDTLVTDIVLCILTENFRARVGRRPRVSELPESAQVALGAKVFEFLDYRDTYHPQMTDEAVYCGCLRDHGVERDRPDGQNHARWLKDAEERLARESKSLSERKRT